MPLTNGLLLLVDGDLGHGVHAEHAGVAAHGGVELGQRVLGGAVHHAGDQREGHRAHHAEYGRHEGVAHAGDQRDDGALHGGGVGHVKPGQAPGQADQRAQKAQRGQKPRQRLGEADAARAVDHGLLVDVVLHVRGVVVAPVREEQVVQIVAPVRKQRALAQEVVLLPGVLLVAALADGPYGAAHQAPGAHHREYASDQSHQEQHHDGDVDHQARDAVHRAREHLLRIFDIFHRYLRALLPMGIPLPL